MKISIITPCYNSARFVGQTLASVTAQTLTDWEQIVVDDGSSDRSVQVIEEWARRESRLRWIGKPNGGVASARNAGFSEASPQSRYLLFLDADDCLEPAFLEEMMTLLEANSDAGLAYSGHTYIDAEDRIVEALPRQMGWAPRYVPKGRWVAELPPTVAATPLVSILSLATILPSLSLIRRSVYEQTPGWDETFGHGYEDTDLTLNLAVRSKVLYLHRPLVRYRRHAQQSTADAEHYARQAQKLLARWRDRTDLTSMQRAEVQAAFRFRETRLLPMQGLDAARRHLRRGSVGAALRFALGAVRRYLRFPLSKRFSE